MRIILPFLCAGWLFLGACNAEKPAYRVVPNETSFPFPTAFPKLADVAKLADFDWERYLQAAESEADLAFRKPIAFSHGHLVGGGGDSNADEMGRYRLAQDELRARCDKLIERFRKKQGLEPEVQQPFEDFIAQSEAALNLQVQLIGGSWGGSGARVAFPKARAHALANYLANLEQLTTSLHFQDLPE